MNISLEYEQNAMKISDLKKLKYQDLVQLMNIY